MTVIVMNNKNNNIWRVISILSHIRKLLWKGAREKTTIGCKLSRNKWAPIKSVCTKNHSITENSLTKIAKKGNWSSTIVCYIDLCFESVLHRLYASIKAIHFLNLSSTSVTILLSWWDHVNYFLCLWIYFDWGKHVQHLKQTVFGYNPVANSFSYMGN